MVTVTTTASATMKLRDRTRSLKRVSVGGCVGEWLGVFVLVKRHPWVSRLSFDA